MIQVTGLKRSFGSFVAVRNVSFGIEPARGVVGLLGPNGAGKTTTMRMLTGYLKPDEGRITVAGLDGSTEAGRLEIKRTIGYLPENNPLYPEMLVSEYLEFMGRARGMDRGWMHRALDLGHLCGAPPALIEAFAALRALLLDESVVLLNRWPTGRKQADESEATER